MARIPKAEIERLEAEVSLQRLAEAAVIELERRGTELVGRCPFHNDQELSLAVSPKENVWRCRGPCRAGGTVVDWVMKTNGVSLRHAVELFLE